MWRPSQPQHGRQNLGVSGAMQTHDSAAKYDFNLRGTSAGDWRRNRRRFSRRPGPSRGPGFKSTVNLMVKSMGAHRIMPARATARKM